MALQQRSICVAVDTGDQCGADLFRLKLIPRERTLISDNCSIVLSPAITNTSFALPIAHVVGFDPSECSYEPRACGGVACEEATLECSF